jgi:hypothetical protein
VLDAGGRRLLERDFRKRNKGKFADALD